MEAPTATPPWASSADCNGATTGRSAACWSASKATGTGATRKTPIRPAEPSPRHQLRWPSGYFYRSRLQTGCQGWSSEEKIEWLTTWRARLGWAHDCYLWYITGGVAWAKIETNYTLFLDARAHWWRCRSGTGSRYCGDCRWGVAAANFSTTRTGWVLGGGVETDIGALFGLGGHNWSMKLEYLYVDLGNVDNTVGNRLGAGKRCRLRQCATAVPARPREPRTSTARTTSTSRSSASASTTASATRRLLRS